MNKTGRGWKKQPLDVKAYSGKRREKAAKKTHAQIEAETAEFLRNGGRVKHDHK